MFLNKLCAASISIISTFGVFGCGGETDGMYQSGEPYAGVIGKYVAAQGPAQLMKNSTVVIRGTTGTPHEGRIWGQSREDWGASTTLIVPVTIDMVESGELAPTVSDTLYLEMEAPAEQQGYGLREQFAQSMTDREGVFFLRRAPERSSVGIEIVNPDAGRPAGQPIYQSSAPEGILITERDGDGVWSVENGTSFPESSLEDFGPEQTEFPPGKDTDDHDNTPSQGLPIS